MVIFAIAAWVTPYFKSWWKVLPWALGAAVCLSRMYLGAHFPLDVIAGGGGPVHRGRAEPRIRRAQRQLQHCPRRRITVSSRTRLAATSWVRLCRKYARTRISAIGCP